MSILVGGGVDYTSYQYNSEFYLENRKIFFCINVNKNAKEKLSSGFEVTKIKTDTNRACFRNSWCNQPPPTKIGLKSQLLSGQKCSIDVYKICSLCKVLLTVKDNSYHIIFCDGTFMLHLYKYQTYKTLSRRPRDTALPAGLIFLLHPPTQPSSRPEMGEHFQFHPICFSHTYFN